MARYLQMLLAGGMGPASRVLSADGVVQLLAPASPPGRSQLLSADFQFRYGEGWFVGPFGAATDARWPLGNWRHSRPGWCCCPTTSKPLWF